MIDLRKMLGQLGTRLDPTRKIGLDLSGVPSAVPPTYVDIKFRNGNTLKDNAEGQLVLADVDGNETIIETDNIPAIPEAEGKYNLAVDSEGAVTWELDTDSNMPEAPEAEGAYSLNVDAQGDATWGAVDVPDLPDAPAGAGKYILDVDSEGVAAFETLENAGVIVSDPGGSPSYLAGFVSEDATMAPTSMPAEKSALGAVLAEYICDTFRRAVATIFGTFPRVAGSATTWSADAFPGAASEETLENPDDTFVYPGVPMKLTVAANAGWGTDGSNVTSFIVRCLDCAGNPFAIDMKSKFSGVNGGIAGVVITRGGVKIGISRIESVTAKMVTGNVPNVNVSAIASDVAADVLSAAYAPFLDGADAIVGADVLGLSVNAAAPGPTGVDYLSVVDTATTIIDAESGLLLFDLDSPGPDLTMPGIISNLVLRQKIPNVLSTTVDAA